MTDRLDRIEALLDRMAQDSDRRAAESEHRLAAIDARLDRVAQENAQRAAEQDRRAAEFDRRLDRMAQETDRRFAAMDARLDRIDRLVTENSSAIGELTAQAKTNTLAIGALAESIESLQNLTRETQTQVQQIWGRIQEILTELRNRFPGNGRG